MLGALFWGLEASPVGLGWTESYRCMLQFFLSKGAIFFPNLIVQFFIFKWLDPDPDPDPHWNQRWSTTLLKGKQDTDTYFLPVGQKILRWFFSLAGRFDSENPFIYFFRAIRCHIYRNWTRILILKVHSSSQKNSSMSIFIERSHHGFSSATWACYAWTL